MSNIEWTEAHRREARAWMYEVAALAIRAGADPVAVANFLAMSVATEAHLREAADVVAGVSVSMSVNAIVRRIDGLATGRLVRETWRELRAGNIRGRRHVRFGKHNSRASAFAKAHEWGLDIKRGWRVVRVTRIRRPR